MMLEHRCFGLALRCVYKATEVLALLPKRVLEPVSAHVELPRALRMGNNKGEVHFATFRRILHSRIVPKFGIVAR